MPQSRRGLGERSDPWSGGWEWDTSREFPGVTSVDDITVHVRVTTDRQPVGAVPR